MIPELFYAIPKYLLIPRRWVKAFRIVVFPINGIPSKPKTQVFMQCKQTTEAEPYGQTESRHTHASVRQKGRQTVGASVS